jgi:hypothetical protein
MTALYLSYPARLADDHVSVVLGASTVQMAFFSVNPRQHRRHPPRVGFELFAERIMQ